MNLSKLLHLLLSFFLITNIHTLPRKSRKTLNGHCIFSALPFFVFMHFQGPKGENVGSITQPLPSSYLIFRAASESDGKFGSSFGFSNYFKSVEENRLMKKES